MKYTIPTIPTKYRGVLFRSRLEARWALFFDALDMGFHWEYEPESFRLDSKSGYIPDFKIHTPGRQRLNEKDWFYAEVKPSGGDFTKAMKFAKLHSLTKGAKPFVFLQGPPNDETLWKCFWPNNDWKGNPLHPSYHETNVTLGGRGRLWFLDNEEPHSSELGEHFEIAAALANSERFGT